ncbi:MAG: hypothetical protein AB7F64_03000 [Gammaproteobacteria bacterium]
MHNNNFINEFKKISSAIGDIIKDEKNLRNLYESNRPLYEKKMEEYRRRYQEQMTAKQDNKDFNGIYPGKMKFSEFKNLTKIQDSSNLQQASYLYFDPAYIKNFDKVEQADLQRFLTVTKPENLSFCGANGQQGIKGLKNSKIKVKLNINGVSHEEAITHEIKIHNSTSRIFLFPLRPVGQGPVIYVAGFFDSKGLHDGHKISQVVLKDLNISKYSSVTQAGMFRKPKDHRDRDLQTEHNHIPVLVH